MPITAPELSSKVLSAGVVAIGASTGGTEAIRTVLASLPERMPPIVMVQHMPESFTRSFAQRLDGQSRLQVIEAAGGELLQPGYAYLAPGHSHLSIRKRTGGYGLELARTEPVNRHRPSVDVLFNSVAREAKATAIGIILTGMGKDGARGLLAMREAGAWTIGQDESTCIVYGMPREAAMLGGVAEVVPLERIAERLLVRLAHLDHAMAG